MSAVNEKLRETSSVRKQEAEICARGTGGDRSNLSECVCVLGVTTSTTLKFKRPMTASGVLSTGLLASLVFSFCLSDQLTHLNHKKVEHVGKLAWSNLGVVLCLAVKSNARNCELSLLRLCFFAFKIQRCSTPSFYSAKQGRKVNKGGRSCLVQKHHMTGYPAAHAKLIITFSKQVREGRLLQKRVAVRAYESVHSHFITR